jgi:hypothetical protein
MPENENLEQKYGPVPVTLQERKEAMDRAFAADVEANVRYQKALKAEQAAMTARRETEVSVATAQKLYSKLRSEYIVAAGQEQ